MVCHLSDDFFGFGLNLNVDSGKGDEFFCEWLMNKDSKIQGFDSKDIIIHDWTRAVGYGFYMKRIIILKAFINFPVICFPT